MKTPWIFPAAALLVGGAGGFLAGKAGSSATPTAEKTVTAARSARANAGSSGASSAENGRTARAKSLDGILKTPGQLGRVQALLDFYQNLDPSQLEAEAAKLENLPLNERLMASLLLFGRWAETDPTGAMAHADKMGMAGMFAKPTILQSWASTDPESAAKYFSEHPREFQMMGMGPGGRGNNGASVIASEWAKSDPEAALAWAQSLQGREKGQAMTSVVRELAQSDPQKAVQLASTLDGDAKADAYSSIAGQWGAKNFSEAEVWIKSLPADQQAGAMASAIESLANQDPKIAATKIGSLADGDDKKAAIASVVDSWSRTDPKAAAEWLLSQGETNTSGQAMRDLMGNWARTDDAGAVNFINQQPAGQARDQATQSYIWSNRSDNPQSVMSMAESISDERERQRALGAAAGQWMQSDPEAAKAYIQQSTTISDEAKQRLQSGRMWGGPGGRRRNGN